MNDLFLSTSNEILSESVTGAWPDNAGEQFWNQWFPGHQRKHSKKQVIEKLGRIRKSREATWADVIGGLHRFMGSQPDPKFVCAPMVWLNQQRWMVNYQPPQPARKTFGDVMRGMG